MLFKNLTPYLITDNSQPFFSFTEEQWKEALLEYEFTPCSSNDLKKTGWLSEETIIVNNSILLTLKTEEKILPKDFVKHLLEEKIEEKEQEENRKLKKAEKQALKENIIAMLLPRAFSKFSLQYLIIDFSNGIIYVNSSSNKQSEEILAMLRKTLGKLPVIPLTFKKKLSTELRALLLKETIIPEIGISDEFELFAGEGVISCKKTELEAEEELRQVVDQKEVSKISVNFSDLLYLTICDNGVFKKLKFEVKEQNISENTADLSKKEKDELKKQEDLIFMSSTFREFFQTLDKTFKIQKSENN